MPSSDQQGDRSPEEIEAATFMAGLSSPTAAVAKAASDKSKRKVAKKTSKPVKATPKSKKKRHDPRPVQDLSTLDPAPHPFFFYTDHSLDTDITRVHLLNDAGHVPSFPLKLHAILSDPELHHIIQWSSHGRSFKILRPRDFAADVLFRFFNATTWNSFQRQINGWGFRRIKEGEDKDGYYEEHFLRGIPWMIKKMRRHKVGEKLKTTAAYEPDLAEISLMFPLPADPETREVQVVLETIKKGANAKIPPNLGLEKASIPSSNPPHQVLDPDEEMVGGVPSSNRDSKPAAVLSHSVNNRAPQAAALNPSTNIPATQAAPLNHSVNIPASQDALLHTRGNIPAPLSWAQSQASAAPPVDSFNQQVLSSLPRQDARTGVPCLVVGQPGSFQSSAVSAGPDPSHTSPEILAALLQQNNLVSNRLVNFFGGNGAIYDPTRERMDAIQSYLVQHQASAARQRQGDNISSLINIDNAASSAGYPLARALPQPSQFQVIPNNTAASVVPESAIEMMIGLLMQNMSNRGSLGGTGHGLGIQASQHQALPSNVFVNAANQAFLALQMQNMTNQGNLGETGPRLGIQASQHQALPSNAMVNTANQAALALQMQNGNLGGEAGLGNANAIGNALNNRNDLTSGQARILDLLSLVLQSRNQH